MDTLNNPTFVRKLITGDTAAFATLCNSLNRKLPEFIVREIGLNYSDAEEVASYALFKVHSSIASFQPKPNAKLTTWIFEIAKHAAIDRRRKLSTSFQDSVKDVFDDGCRINSASQKTDLFNRPSYYEERVLGEDPITPSNRVLPYKKAFDKLTEREQDILRMKNVLTYEEISDVERETVGALRTRHFRAVKRLRDFAETIIGGCHE